MGKLTCGMMVTRGRQTEDEAGDFGWGAPEDEVLHADLTGITLAARTRLRAGS